MRPAPSRYRYAGSDVQLAYSCGRTQRLECASLAAELLTGELRGFQHLPVARLPHGEKMFHFVPVEDQAAGRSGLTLKLAAAVSALLLTARHHCRRQPQRKIKIVEKKR